MKFINGKFSFLFIFPILLGFFISIYSWDGIVYFFDQNNSRIPAENIDTLNFKNLKSRKIRHSYKEIISDLTIITRTDSNITLNLKSFYLKKEKLSVCKKYDIIFLSFVALNIAVNGNPPTIVIKAPCSTDISNSEYLSSIIIPINEIRSLDPSLNTSFIYENQTFEFTNIEDEWPKDFRLNKAIFKNSNNQNQELSINIFNNKPSIEFQL